ncbi:MAG: hypothetical protein KDA38_15180 [Planctomycetales bacterium]|nr:hypothetical protein [Planctomycetales bacterium]
MSGTMKSGDQPTCAAALRNRARDELDAGCFGDGWPKLLAAFAVIAFVWLVLLPICGSQPALRERLDAEAARGIDGGAMFYTELEMADELIRRPDRR